MHRIAGLFAIGLGACSVAGCGGASLQQVARQDSKRLLGDPHPRILRTETVRIVDGAREAVVQMHGHFTIVPNCPMVTPPSKSRCHTLHPRYVVLTFGLPTPSSSQGYSTTSRSQIAAIARARSAQQELAIFPDFNGEVVRCAIPRGSPPGGTIGGTCVTYALPYKHAKRVEFIEHWPQSQPSGTRTKAGWLVTLSRDGRVRSTSVMGQPPQLWK
ncbi:MAG TPA: hypothetical protein VGI69_09090 [Gaiellaceae bacterium]|jgi:hypothetical protein